MRAVVLLSVALVACSGARGCLRSGPSPEEGSPREKQLELAGTDCSDGLLRCAGGRVEASRIGHIPQPCAGPSCSCPWSEVAICRAGCIDEEVDVIGGADAGLQLCKPEVPTARPLLAGEAARAATVCAEEGLRCEEGEVIECAAAGRLSRTVARCIYGCEPAVAIAHGSSPIGGGAHEILCRRLTPERR